MTWKFPQSGSQGLEPTTDSQVTTVSPTRRRRVTSASIAPSGWLKPCSARVRSHHPPPTHRLLVAKPSTTRPGRSPSNLVPPGGQRGRPPTNTSGVWCDLGRNQRWSNNVVYEYKLLACPMLFTYNRSAHQKEKKKRSSEILRLKISRTFSCLFAISFRENSKFASLFIVSTNTDLKCSSYVQVNYENNLVANIYFRKIVTKFQKGILQEMF